MYYFAMSKNLIIGFILLPIGILVTPLLPEFGVPIILLSTRFLQEKYLWAKKLNIWVDTKFAYFKAAIRKFRKK
jgi:uncharacterized membrane protein YbaN (DUF454 family)